MVDLSIGRGDHLKLLYIITKFKMYTAIIILSFLSVWCLYLTSNKIELEKTGLSLRLSNQVVLSSACSFFFFLIQTCALVMLTGVLAGIFASVSLWMLVISIVVLFTPFQKIKKVHLFLSTVFCFTIELWVYLIVH